MIARKAKLKIKPRKLSLAVRKSRYARRVAKTQALNARLLFLRTHRLLSESAMKRSKKLLSHEVGYWRLRHKTVRRWADAARSRLLAKRLVWMTQNVRTVRTNKFRRNLYTSRAHALSAGRRKLAIHMRRYRKTSSRYVRLRLRQYRRLLYRRRIFFRRRLTGNFSVRRSRRVLRALMPFLQIRTRRVVWKRSTRRRWRAKLHTKFCYAVSRKQKRLQQFVIAGLSRNRTPKTLRALFSVKKPRRARRRFGKQRGKKLKSLRFLRPRRLRRKKLKLWFSLRRLRRRLSRALRYQFRVRRGFSSRKGLSRNVPSALRYIRHRRSKERLIAAKRKRHFSARRKKLRKVYRKYRAKSAVLRFRRKWQRRKLARRTARFLQRRRHRFAAPGQTWRVREKQVRQLFRLPAACTRAWLYLISKKTYRSAPSRSLRKRALPSKLRSLSASRKSAVLLLQTAVTSRTQIFKASRRLLRVRIAGRVASSLLVRRRGRRSRVFFIWAKAHRARLQEERRNQRQVRRLHTLQRSRGRGWARWRRMPRRFFSLHPRAVRGLFAVRQKLFRRGLWTYFYRDRDFKPRFYKKATGPVTSFPSARAELPARGATPHPRSTQRAQWYAFRAASGRARAALFEKEGELAALVGRRMLTQRKITHGAAYSLPDHVQPTHATAACRRSALRRLCGRRVRRRTPRYKSIVVHPLPRILRQHRGRSTPAPSAAGGFVRCVLLTRRRRLLRSIPRFAAPKTVVTGFTSELQRELTVVAVPPRSMYRLLLKTVDQPAALQEAPSFSPPPRLSRGQRANNWLRQLRHEFRVVKLRLLRAQRSRRTRKPRAWRRLLKVLDFESALADTFDNALNIFNTPYAKIQPKTKTKVQLKTKKTKALAPRAAPKTIKKIPTSSHKSWSTSLQPAPRPKIGITKNKKK